jgi:hypothetical protein
MTQVIILTKQNNTYKYETEQIFQAQNFLNSITDFLSKFSEKIKNMRLPDNSILCSNHIALISLLNEVLNSYSFEDSKENLKNKLNNFKKNFNTTISKISNNLNANSSDKDIIKEFTSIIKAIEEIITYSEKMQQNIEQNSKILNYSTPSM